MAELGALRRGLVASMLAAALATMERAALAESDGVIAQAVAAEAQSILPSDDVAGAAVALQLDGSTHLFTYGWADSTRDRRVTPDTLFNLASVSKVFDATLLALAIKQGEVGLDDPVAQYVTELRGGGDIQRVTLGQLATYTSGFTLPQDHPPWPEETFTWPKFVQVLKSWKADEDHEPGKQVIYSHAGFMLLHIALERRFGMPFGKLLEQRVLAPLGLASTMLPSPGATFRGELPPDLKDRAVQGYSSDGLPTGEPGEQQGFYHWPGTGQMYASLRDVAVFLNANLGERAYDDPLSQAMQLAQQGVFVIDAGARMGLAWEIYDFGGITVVEKYGGLNNASAYIGMVAGQRIGIVMLANRGDQDVANAGRRLLVRLSGRSGAATGSGDAQ